MIFISLLYVATVHLSELNEIDYQHFYICYLVGQLPLTYLHFINFFCKLALQFFKFKLIIFNLKLNWNETIPRYNF